MANPGSFEWRTLVELDAKAEQATDYPLFVREVLRWAIQSSAVANDWNAQQTLAECQKIILEHADPTEIDEDFPNG